MFRSINGLLFKWKQFKVQFKTRRPQMGVALEFAETLLGALIIALFLRQFVVQSSMVFSGSMKPTLVSKSKFDSDRLFVNKLVYHFNSPNRGDVILFDSPHGDGKQYVKRLIGLPGETVEIRRGLVYVNDQLLVFPGVTIRRDYSNHGKLTVPDGHFFVLGDNRDSSADSRAWGFVRNDQLIGQAMFIYWPFSRIRWIK